MKIKKSKLKQIIKEELNNLLSEIVGLDTPTAAPSVTNPVVKPKRRKKPKPAELAPGDQEFQQSHPDIGADMSVTQSGAQEMKDEAEAQRMKSLKYQLYKAKQELRAARKNMNDAIGIAGVANYKGLPRNHVGRVAYRKAYRKLRGIQRKMKVGSERRQARKLAAKGTALTPQGTSPQVSARVRKRRAADVEKRAAATKKKALAVTGDAEKKMKAADIAGSAEKIGKKSARLKDKAAADVKRTSSPAYRKVQSAKKAHDAALSAYEQAQRLASYGPEYKKKAEAAGRKEAAAKKRLQAAEAALNK